MRSVISERKSRAHRYVADKHIVYHSSLFCVLSNQNVYEKKSILKITKCDWFCSYSTVLINVCEENTPI